MSDLVYLVWSCVVYLVLNLRTSLVDDLKRLCILFKSKTRL